jgi:hypothetical protein
LSLTGKTDGPAPATGRRWVPAPGNGQVAGIDRGVAVAAALSTGTCCRSLA